MGDLMRRRIAVATLILAGLLAAASLWGSGIVNTRGGGDSPFLLQRTHQMLANLQAGIFPVRWMGDAAYGLGYPFFNYYAALPYYMAGFLALLGLDILTALKMVQTLGCIGATLAMYGWMLTRTKNQGAAWLAAVAYTVAPFHLVNVYVRGDSLSEFYAFMFYPLVLWALDALTRSSSQPISRTASLRIMAVALAYGGLIVTHNISAFIFSPFALLYLVILAWQEKKFWKILGLGLLAFGFGFLLSAWFWLPALAELKHVQLGPSTQDFFHYSRHFRTLNLVQKGLLFDYSTTTNHRVRSPFAMGLAQATFAVAGALALIVRLGQRARRRLAESAASQLGAHRVFVLLGLLISTVMITPLSQPLWDHLPLLPVVQFPWRFLSVQALFTAAATAALAPIQLSQRHTEHTAHNLSAIRHLSFVIIPAVLLSISSLSSLQPERLPINSSDVTVERLQLYELFAGNIGTTIRYEWLPGTTSPRPYTSDALVEPGVPIQAIPLNGAPIEAVLVERKPTRQVWHAWGGEGGIAFPLLYWPGWKALVDGEPVETWPIEGSGYIALELPPGEHTITLRLGRTPVRVAGEVTSLVAFVALLAIVARSQVANRKSLVVRWLLVLLLLLVICYLSLAIPPRTALNSDTTRTDLTMDFVKMPYLHRNPDGINFDGVAQLNGYILSAKELAPGDTLTVTLEWSQMDEPCTARLELVSPAVVRYDTEPLAEATLRLETLGLKSKVRISTPITLQLPDDTPRGVYLVQLNLFGPRGELQARTPRGKGYGTLYLQPVRVRRGPPLPRDLSVLAGFGPAIRLHAINATQPGPDRLVVQLNWSTAHRLAANYGISLRLLDGSGQTREQRDTQPGYGFLPTSSWRPGELIADRYVLTLPDDLPPGDEYYLEAVLYQVSKPETVLAHAQTGSFTLPLDAPFETRRDPRTFTLPSLRNPLDVEFGGEVRLAGYDLELAQGEDSLNITLWWQTLENPRADYTVFLHLFDPATESIVAQMDAQPQGGAYPTSWWVTGEVVSDTVTLALTDVPEGTYQVAIGLYDQTLARLQASAREDQGLIAIDSDRLILPEVILVEE